MPLTGIREDQFEESLSLPQKTWFTLVPIRIIAPSENVIVTIIRVVAEKHNPPLSRILSSLHSLARCSAGGALRSAKQQTHSQGP